MSLFKKLKDILFSTSELKEMSELYANQRYWNILVKAHNMRIAQLGEEMMSINTMTPEGQVKEHGCKERVKENEYFLTLFKAEFERQEKAKRKQDRMDNRKQKFHKINYLKDL